MTSKATSRLLAQRLVALFVAGALLFGFPLLGLVLGEGTLWLELLGLPPAAAWLFGGWALLILVLALLLERRHPAGRSPDTSSGG